MYRIILLSIILLNIFSKSVNCSLNTEWQKSPASVATEQDTLMENQALYSGRSWSNRYRRINGDQFLFTSYFLPGTVSSNGKTFKNLLIRYDIYEDEIMIPANREEIVKLNKEMVDSFTIRYENQVYKFSKIGGDTLHELKGYKGYICVLYKEKSGLYIKYKKDIRSDFTEKSDGVFIQSQKVYFVKNGVVHPFSGANDLYKTLDSNIIQIKHYIRNAGLKVSGKRPESYIPVIRYYDSISR
jgi:hypothetical protein